MERLSTLLMNHLYFCWIFDSSIYDHLLKRCKNPFNKTHPFYNAYIYVIIEKYFTNHFIWMKSLSLYAYDHTLLTKSLFSTWIPLLNQWTHKLKTPNCTSIINLKILHTSKLNCTMQELITTQKEHILDNNSYEFHIFWAIIMPKTLN